MRSLPTQTEPTNTAPKGTSERDFDAALDRCASALAAIPEPVAFGRLFPPVNDFAVEARRMRVPPERWLAALKEILTRTPALATFEIPDRERMTATLIAQSIDVFFSSVPQRAAESESTAPPTGPPSP